MPDLPRDAPIFVSGHRGMVGSALLRRLQQSGFTNTLVATRDEVDLRDQAAVDRWFAAHRPRFVLHAAGAVGGIQANVARPAEFMYDNLLIHATVLRAAWQYSVEKLLYLGSSCVYPRDCPQPMREEFLITGLLEETNESYALAKIAGVKSCIAYRRQYGCNFISALPTNLYGPYGHFELANSHVLAALLRKFHDARVSGVKTVVIWGSGSPRREFLHVDDLAEACLTLLERYDEETPINVGCGDDLTIAGLASLVREAVYPEADLVYDATMPDGVPRKLLDCSRLAGLGWQPRIAMREGIANTYRWFCDNPTAYTA